MHMSNIIESDTEIGAPQSATAKYLKRIVLYMNMNKSDILPCTPTLEQRGE